MSFIQDNYRIEDPRDVTIQSLRKLVASLNVKLGQMADRIAVLEGSRPGALDAGGYSITNVQYGNLDDTAVVTNLDLANRSISRANLTDPLAATARIQSRQGVTRTTIAQNPNEVPTIAQLREQEERTGVVIRMEADVTFTNTTAFADIPGLSFAVAENTDYTIDATIVFTTGATNMGINLACNGPASPTNMSFLWTAPSTTSAQVARTVTAYDTSVANATSTAGDNTARFKGTFRCGATPGTFQMRGSTDSSISTVTVLAGSTLVYKRTT